MKLKGRLRKGVEILSPLPNELILDLGCASAYVEEAMLKRGIRKMIGVDISDFDLRLAKRKSPELILVRCDAHHLPFRDGIFNKILCLETLEHVKDDNRVLKEISRVLKHNGTLALSVPNNIPNLNFWDPNYVFWKLFQRAEHRHRHYDVIQIKSKLKNANILIESYGTYGSFFSVLDVWLSVIMSILKKSVGIASNSLSDVVDREFSGHPRKLGVTLFVRAKKRDDK